MFNTILNTRAKGVPNFYYSRRCGLVLGFVISCAKITNGELDAYKMACNKLRGADNA